VTGRERRRVLLLDDILEPAAGKLAAACEVARPPAAEEIGQPAIRRAGVGREGILSLVTHAIGEEVLSLPGLRIVSNVGVGYDNIDVAAATRHGVMVTNTPGVLDETTADLAFGLLLDAGRRVSEGDRLVRRGGFRTWSIDHMLGQDVHGATLGVVGLGRIGEAVARRARGFGMRVLCATRTPLAGGRERELGVTRVDLGTLLAESDFVTLHVPLSAETRHMIGARELRLMKPTAVLVNTARGPIVDEAALVEALAVRRIFAAGLDVYEDEPRVHPGLLELDNVVLAPHIGSASVRTRSRMCEMAVDNLLAGLRGETPPNLVNPTATA
jgi:glyoxylate reductase